MGFDPRGETGLIDPAGRHIFHNHDCLGSVRNQPPSIHQ